MAVGEAAPAMLTNIRNTAAPQQQEQDNVSKYDRILITRALEMRVRKGCQATWRLRKQQIFEGDDAVDQLAAEIKNLLGR